MSSEVVNRIRKRLAERAAGRVDETPPTEDFLEQPFNDAGTSDSGEISDVERAKADLGPYRKIPGTVDPRLKELSFSSRSTLHTCPKKFQLYRLRIGKAEGSFFQSVSNAFGHSCGLAAQLIFREPMPSLGEVLWKQFLEWPDDIGLWEENAKDKKGFWYAAICSLKLWHARSHGFLHDWYIVDYNGKPAVELSFEVILPNGFRYRGFVDAVIRNRVTGAVGVLERKTTKFNTPDPSQFKNSTQALGYSIVLDHIAPEISSYSVLYLVYSSTLMEETVFDFPKSLSQRAEWIQEIMFDIDHINEFDEARVYPRNGAACFDFFRPCEYFQTCHLSVERLAKEYSEEVHADKTAYDISVTLEELIETQLNRHGVQE